MGVAKPRQNSPQSMRVWPGLRLIGAGGKIPKGVFVAVAEVEPDGHPDAPPRYLAQVKTAAEALHRAAAGAGGAAPPGRHAGLPRGRDEAVAGQQ